jgi:pimeloyl-ACP methyl ester carboxylesterase
MSDSTSDFVTDDGVRLAYSVVGEGFPIVLSNGLGILKEAWAETADSFSRYGKVITYNLRNQGKEVAGHGDTYLMDRHVSDLEQLLAHLEIDRIAGVGISTGTRILSDLALARPELVRSLVLMGYGGEALAERNQIVFRSWLHTLLSCPIGDLSPFADALLPWVYSPAYLARSAAAVPEIAKAIELIMTRDGLAANVRASMISLDNSYERSHRNSTIKARTLILQGEFDMLTPPAFLKSVSQRFDDCTIKVVSGSGHNVRAERRGEFESSALEFFFADPEF